MTAPIHPPLGKKPKAILGHRVCSAPDCVTTLSIYNPSDTCYLHSPRTVVTKYMPRPR